jgi:iron complex outermembrane receptor protein
MAYVSYNRGAKSGQYDTFGTAAGGPIKNPPVNPEVLKSVEAGLKSEWLDHRLQLNLSAFHYDVSNLQMAVIKGGGTQLLNAASATVNGGEVSASVIPIENLTLTGGLSFLYGSYGSFKNAPDYFPPNAYFPGSNYAQACPQVPNKVYTCNASGLDMIRAPHFSSNFGADYVVPSSFGDFDLNANWAYTESYYEFPDESMSQPATNIVNASITWTNPTGMFDVRLWSNNLTGDKYYSFGSESVGYGQEFSPAAPRTYGITLTAHI